MIRFLVALIATGAIGAACWFGWQAMTAKPLAAALQTAGDATVGEGAAQAALEAERIAQAGADRDRTIITQREVIREQILTAPGADQPLDPGLIAAINRGVCKRAASRDDPRCDQLRR